MFKNVMKHASSGFLLPVIILLGVGISGLGVFGLSVISNNRVGINNQNYGNLAKEASAAGLVFAQSCLSTTVKGILWSSSVLEPNNTCSGGVGSNSKYIINDSSKNLTTTFRVSYAPLDTNGKTKLTSIGEVSVNGVVKSTEYSRYVFSASYPAPTYTSISPASGGTGTSTTITGANFVSGNTTVTVGGVTATTTFGSATTLTVVIPIISTSGAKNVVITTSGGSVTGTGVFYFYAVPAFYSISPNEGITGKTATISGSNFTTGTSVTIGGVIATTTIVNATTLTVVIPSIGTEGVKSVVVSNAGGSDNSGSYIYWFTRSPVTTAWVGAVGVATYIPPNWANKFDMVVLGGGGGGETGGAGFRNGRGGGAGSWNAATIGRVSISYPVSIPLGGAGGVQVGLFNCGAPAAGGTAVVTGVVSASGGAIYARPSVAGGATGGSPGSYTFNGVTYGGGGGGGGGGGSGGIPGGGGGGGAGFLAGGCTSGGTGGYAGVWIRAYQNY